MSDDRVGGVFKEGVGRLQGAAGAVTGDDRTQVKGKLNEAAGAAQNAYGQLKDQASGTLSQARDQAEDLYDQVEAFVRDQPLAAVAVAAGLGLVLGLLIRGGRKVVYVRK